MAVQAGGRCRKGVDRVLDCYPKLVAIDEEADHQIVPRCRFGKANRAAHEPLDPGMPIEVFARDFLRVLFAHCVLLWVNTPLVGAHPSV